MNKKFLISTHKLLRIFVGISIILLFGFIFVKCVLMFIAILGSKIFDSYCLFVWEI